MRMSLFGHYTTNPRQDSLLGVYKTGFLNDAMFKYSQKYQLPRQNSGVTGGGATSPGDILQGVTPDLKLFFVAEFRKDTV